MNEQATEFGWSFWIWWVVPCAAIGALAWLSNVVGGVVVGVIGGGLLLQLGDLLGQTVDVKGTSGDGRALR